MTEDGKETEPNIDVAKETKLYFPDPQEEGYNFVIILMAFDCLSTFK